MFASYRSGFARRREPTRGGDAVGLGASDQVRTCAVPGDRYRPWFPTAHVAPCLAFLVVLVRKVWLL